MWTDNLIIIGFSCHAFTIFFLKMHLQNLMFTRQRITRHVLTHLVEETTNAFREFLRK